MCQTLALEINGHDRGSDSTTSPTMGPKSSLNSLSNFLTSSIFGDTLSNFNLHHIFMWESNIKADLFDKTNVYET